MRVIEGEASVRLGPNLKGSLPFILFLYLIIICPAQSQDRYVLQSRIEEDQGTSITEIYLDQLSQRIIVKEFDRSGTVGPIGEESMARISEAWRPAPSGWSLRKVSDYDLTQKNSQESAREAIRSIIPDEGEEVFQKTMNQVRTGYSRYRLMQIGNRENTQVGVYFNESLGEFVFQSVSNKTSREHQFAATFGLVTDLDNVGNDQTPLERRVLAAKTYHQMLEATNKIKDLMKDHGFSIPEGTFQSYFEQVRKYQEKFERLQLKETSTGIFEEVLFHPESNELLFRRYTYKEDGSQNVLEETFYDLNDDVGYEQALLRFQGMGEKEVEILRNIVVMTGGCEKPLVTTMPLGEVGEKNLDDINQVLESLWRSELQAGLPETIERGPSNTINLQLSLFGREHPLVGNLDRFGRIIDLNFRNPGLARDKKMRISHIVGDNGEKQFLVEAFNEISKEWEAQVVLESERGLNSSGQRIPRLSAYLRGQQGEGRFNFDGFEKSTYDLNISDGQLASVGPRFRYDGSRSDIYNNVVFEREGGGGLVNLGFQLFFSRNGRREKVRETILEQARETFAKNDYSDLVTDNDIQIVANEVTEAVALRTDNFGQSKNRIEAVATEESFSRFGEMVLTRMVNSLIPDEEDTNISNMVNIVLRDFRLCLKKASSARNSDMANHCMAIFMREAPIDVAKEILKLKLVQSSLGDFTDVGERDFLACTQENYDPVKTRVEGDEGLTLVQGCLYKALMETVDKVAPALIDQQVGEISRDLNLNLNYRSERLTSARERSRQCLREEGVGRYGPRGYEVNLQSLGIMGADLFEQAFMSCMNLLVEDVALSVGEVALAARLSEIELSDEAKSIVMEDSFSPGLKECIDRQKSSIKSLRQLYQNKRAELVAQTGSDRNLNVGIVVPSFDPLECNRVLTNLGTGHAANQTMIQMLGLERYESIIEKEGKDPLQCFLDFHKHQLDQVPIWLLKNADVTEAEKEIESKKRDAASEERSAVCLKDAIVMSSYYIAQDLLEEKLSESPEYASIELTNEAKNKVGESVRQCFQEKLENYVIVSEILLEQEKLKDVCAVELLKDPDVQPFLFTPFINDSLSQVEMTEETKERITTKLLATLSERLNGAANLDQAMAKLEIFKPEAIPIVLNGVLTQKIEEMIGAVTPAAKAQAQELVQRVEREIFGEDGQGELGQNLIKALNEKDDAAIKLAITAIEAQSAKVLGPNILREKANKMLADGILQTQADAELVVSKGTEILNTCLGEAKVTEDPIKFCVEETTVRVTEYIMRLKLRETLEGHPLLSEVFTTAQRQAIEDTTVSDEFFNELRAIAAMEDGPIKDQKMDDFVLNFKMNSTKEVFKVGLLGIIEEKLPTPRYFQGNDLSVLDSQRERLGRNATQNLRSCIDSLQEKMRSTPEHDISEIYLDECINESRLELTKEILPKRLEFILQYLHGDLDRIAGLRNKATVYFNNCAQVKEKRVNSSEFGNHLDGCLNTTIGNFVGDVLQDMRDVEPIMLAGGDTLADWSLCQQNLKERALNHVYPDGAPEEVKELMNTESSFYGELYRVGDLSDPSRSPDLDWLIPNLIECAVEKIVPNLTIEFRNSFLARHDGEIDDTAKDLVISLTDSVYKIFSMERDDGTPVVIEIGSLFGKPASEEKPELINSIELEVTSKPNPIINLLGEFEPVVIEYLNMAGTYDPEGMKIAIDEFERISLERLASSKGDIPLETIVDTLLESNLTDVVIESMIAGIVKEETSKALNEEGADTAVVWLLSSKLMIRRLFSQGKGKDVIEKMKQEYLKPLLMGQLSDISLPTDLMNEVKDVLVKDTVKGGFVETLFGPIIQNKLNEKRDWIESGWTSIFKMPVAGFQGLNRNRDFTWGNRFDPQSLPQHLRNTPSGQKAVEHFAENLLGPMLRGELSAEDKEKASDTISDIVREAMDENQ